MGAKLRGVPASRGSSKGDLYPQTGATIVPVVSAGPQCHLSVPDPITSVLVWVLREEQGEQGGRRHFHFLLSGTSLPLTPAGCHILQRVWERVGGGRGFAKVKVYDRALSGAAYVTKCLSWVGTADGASYELRKFARTEEPPILSKSLIRRLGRLIDLDHRRLYLSSTGEEGKLPGSVKTGQPKATCGGLAPGNPGTIPPNDDKTGMANHGPDAGQNPF